LTWTW